MIEQVDIEQYIRTHQLPHGDWCAICQNYKLSEDLIREYADDVEWYYICKCQRLSEEFMREFPEKLWFQEVLKYQKLSTSLVRWIVEYNKFTTLSLSSLKNVLKVRNVYNEEYEKIFDEYERTLNELERSK